MRPYGFRINVIVLLTPAGTDTTDPILLLPTDVAAGSNFCSAPPLHLIMQRLCERVQDPDRLFNSFIVN